MKYRILYCEKKLLWVRKNAYISPVLLDPPQENYAKITGKMRMRG